MKNRILLSLLCFLLWLPSPAQEQAAVGVIAHRGYWKADGAAENSIAALIAAQQLGVYGSEFDVWITADGVAVIHHNATIQGVRIENVPYREIEALTLSNGERLPTLEAYLKAGARHKQTRLILEIKPHSTPSREEAAVQEALRLVRATGVADQTEYISFSAYICRRLHELSPRASVAYLNGDMTPAEVASAGWTGLDYNASVFRKHPEWIGQAHRLGLTTNVWTVNKPADMEYFRRAGIGFITTNEPVVLKELR
ncbi:MAG: glycerophosphodiester phosphodiesterase [Prevotellaceae bacterium]|jgi:glycerophosphoryl diester phosphodiesterase|nr:glycerophosphodiester phosphodiesterase [Prevotellaceae bacterium]